MRSLELMADLLIAGGLGVSIDWDWIDGHTIDRYTFGIGEPSRCLPSARLYPGKGEYPCPSSRAAVRPVVTSSGRVCVWIQTLLI
jgi:hypothetical protein